MIKNKLLISTLIVGTLIAGGISFTQHVYAQEENSKYPLVIQRLIEKFNLNESEVDAVIEETQAEKQQMMQTAMEEQLAQAVADGKITEEQKTLILEKMAEWHAEKEDLRNLTMEERKALMEANREEMQAWAEENGIDLKEILGGMHGIRGKMHHGFGMGSAEEN